MLAVLASCILMSTTDPRVNLAAPNAAQSKPGWTLTWSDEFDGPTGAPVDPKKWVQEVGPHWHNNELQEYTGGTGNTYLDGHGHLVIEAKREMRDGRPHYTSGRLKTEGLFSQAYGRFEARIKLPSGKGIWPAFWMLGDDIGRAGWPGSGELDIVELKGSRPSLVMGTAHGPGYSGGNPRGGQVTFAGGSVAADYHVYAIEWEPGRVRWLLDDDNYFSVTPEAVGNHRWVFDHPFFIILNQAVGGNFDGNPDDTTIFPSKMLVDYVRVYRRKN